MNPYRIFFGMLKQGYPLYDNLELKHNSGIKFVRNIKLQGFQMFDVGYPIIKPGKGYIKGELFYISDKELLRKLDKACLSSEAKPLNKAAFIGSLLLMLSSLAAFSIVIMKCRRG